MVGLATLACLALLIPVHVVTLLRLLEDTSRSFWLSLAGGMSVAYVVLHLGIELGSTLFAAGEQYAQRFS
jgi:uncharacterized membrane protein YhaH (DUF805 family)